MSMKQKQAPAGKEAEPVLIKRNESCFVVRLVILLSLLPLH
jgi:hypothetical protein